MAVDESALSELLEAFRAGDGLDVVREAVRMMFQELIETEFSDVIRATVLITAISTTARTSKGSAHRRVRCAGGDLRLV